MRLVFERRRPPVVLFTCFCFTGVPVLPLCLLPLFTLTENLRARRWEGVGVGYIRVRLEGLRTFLQKTKATVQVSSAP